MKATSFSNYGNTRYFRNIDTHLKAYFVGFITSDGCVNKPTRGGQDRLSIIIDKQDLILLETLKQELNSQNKITISETRNMAGLQIACQDIVNDLGQYGITYRKTFTIPNTLPLIPRQFYNSYLLGLLDGDGCIYRQKRTRINKDGAEHSKYYPVIIFVGTQAVLQGAATYLDLPQERIRQIKGTYEIRIHERESAERVFEILYRDCPTYLERKKQKFYFD